MYQPRTLDHSEDVAAYCYRARTGKTVLPVVNTCDRPYSGLLRLRPDEGKSIWYSGLSGRSVARGQDLPITLAASSSHTTGDLLMLLPLDWLVPTMQLMAAT